MSTNDIITLTDASLITIIVQRSRGEEVVKAAQKAGAGGATGHYGFGTGVRERLGLLGLAVEAEKAFIYIVVADDEVNRIFDDIYHIAQLDTPGMGFMYVTKLDKATTYVPEDLLKKLRHKEE
jgi:nitrogen regulatory protein P-II 1